MCRKNNVFSGNDEEDIKVFEVLYELHYSSLCSLAEAIVRDIKKAEALVENVFVKVWYSRMDPCIYNSLKKSLFRFVLDEALGIAGEVTAENVHKISSRIRQLIQ